MADIQHQIIKLIERERAKEKLRATNATGIGENKHEYAKRLLEYLLADINDIFCLAGKGD